jgi:hypothetical protein
VATYNGDANNNSVSSGCSAEPVTVSNCVVTNTSSGASYADLGSAVNAAAGGDTLDVAGTCGGAEITKALTLTGTTPNATLHGSLSAFLANLTVNSLTISGNNISDGGGGISTIAATLNVNNSTITGNSAGTFGGGIFINSSTVTITNTTITSNTAALNGGGIFNNEGSVTLNNTTIGGSGGGNTADGDGGGIYSQNGGTVTLNGTTSITDNTPDNCVPAVTGCTG